MPNSFFAKTNANNVFRYFAMFAGVSAALAGGYFFGYRSYYDYKPQ